MSPRLLPLCAALLGASLTACVNLAPDYSRPAAPVAPTWGPAAPASAPASAPTAAPATPPADQIRWAEFYADPQLRALIGLALANNRDLRQTALNVEAARAQLQVTRAGQWPTVTAAGSTSAQHSSGNTSHSHSATLGLSAFELDFFGRVRNLRDQALENFLADEENLRAARISLVASVATTYCTLLADQQRLRLSLGTLANQEASLQLTRRTFEVGTASGLDVATAQTSVDTARVDIATYRTSVAQDMNALALLVGQPLDASLVADAGANDSTRPLLPLAAGLGVPAELPSELLQRRPDVLAAERQLRAANVYIGAARAARFPSITLTTRAGLASSQLSALVDSGSRYWSLAPAIAVPLFDGGAGAASVQAAEAARDKAVAGYEATLQTAFKEVADALAAQRAMADLLAARLSLLAASDKSYQLTNARYRRGLDSSLDVLTAQRSFYSAQQNLITARLQEASNQILLYRVLGGGWQ